MSSMPRRFVWIDDSDLFSAKAKLKAVREKQIPEWKWVRWVEDDYESSEDAFKSLMSEIGVPSMFNVGKAIYFYGLPKTHAMLAENLGKIPDGVVVVMIARLNKTYSLYKMAVEMNKTFDEKNCPFRYIELPEFGANDGTCSREYQWVVDRAEALGFGIDRAAVDALLDTFGFVPNILHQELKKLSGLCVDGVIAKWAVEGASQGSGAVDIRNLGDAMTKGNAPLAHKIVKRLLDGGTSPFPILGFLHDWSMKLCLAADASSCNDERMIRLIGDCLKWEKKVEKKEEDEPISSSIEDDYDFKRGKTVKMFASPNFLYHSCKALNESSRSRSWPMRALYHVVEMQYLLRTESLATLGNKYLLAERMHHFVDQVTGE